MFAEILSRIGTSVPGSRGLMIIGVDGIPVEQWVSNQGINLDMVATEFTSLLKSSRHNSRDTGLGDLQQVSILADNGILLLSDLTPDYFMLFLLEPTGNLGRARFELRKAKFALEPELAV